MAEIIKLPNEANANNYSLVNDIKILGKNAFQFLESANINFNFDDYIVDKFNVGDILIFLLPDSVKFLNYNLKINNEILRPLKIANLNNLFYVTQLKEEENIIQLVTKNSNIENQEISNTKLDVVNKNLLDIFGESVNIFNEVEQINSKLNNLSFENDNMQLTKFTIFDDATNDYNCCSTQFNYFDLVVDEETQPIEPNFPINSIANIKKIEVFFYLPSEVVVNELSYDSTSDNKIISSVYSKNLKKEKQGFFIVVIHHKK